MESIAVNRRRGCVVFDGRVLFGVLFWGNADRLDKDPDEMCGAVEAGTFARHGDRATLTQERFRLGDAAGKDAFAQGYADDFLEAVTEVIGADKDLLG